MAKLEERDADIQANSNRQRSLIRRFLDYWQPATSSSYSVSAYQFVEIETSEQQLQEQAINCPHQRRFLPAYQRRLKLVRDAWLSIFSVVLLFQVAAPVVISLCLFSTFLSFAFLDETPMVVLQNS